MWVLVDVNHPEFDKDVLDVMSKQIWRPGHVTAGPQSIYLKILLI